jgi:hypothetical protein
MPSRSVNTPAGCREEVLLAARRLHASGQTDFTPAEIIREMQRIGTRYQNSTIQTHVVSRLCGNAPDNHGTTYSDLERIAFGRYRLRKPGQ